MTIPLTQRKTKTEIQVQHIASTQSTGEFHIPVSELWVWQHTESLRIMRQAKKDLEEGKIVDLTAYLESHDD